jgi:MFS family permease
LFAAQFLGAFNDNVFRFALIIFITFTVAQRTGIDTRSLVVLSGGIFIVPFFLFSAMAGQIADKYEKSRLIRTIKSAEIAVMGLGAVGFWLENEVFLFIVLFLMGAQSTFFGPLKYAVLPQHLEEQELTGGNGLIQMGTYVAILVGAIGGGLLASLKGLGPIPLIASVLGLAVMGRLAAQLIPTAAASDPHHRINRNPATATYALIRYACRDRAIFTLILTISWFWFLGATFLSMVPTYGKELLGANEQAVTLLNAAFTVGIGTGSLLCERLSRRRIELGLVPLGGLGVSVFAADVFLSGIPEISHEALTVGTFFFHADAIRVFFDLVMIGGFGAVFIVPLYAALQTRAEPAHRSRVIAALNVMNALFMVVSALFTMALYHFGVDIPAIFLIVAILNLMALIVSAKALPEFHQRARVLLTGRNNE